MKHSYDDGGYVRYFENEMSEIELDRLHVLLGNEGIEKSDKGEMNSVLLHVG